MKILLFRGMGESVRLSQNRRIGLSKRFRREELVLQQSRVKKVWKSFSGIF